MLNHRAEYLDQCSFRSTFMVRTHTQQIDCSIWITKWTVKGRHYSARIDISLTWWHTGSPF